MGRKLKPFHNDNNNHKGKYFFLNAYKLNVVLDEAYAYVLMRLAEGGYPSRCVCVKVGGWFL